MGLFGDKGEAGKICAEGRKPGRVFNIRIMAYVGVCHIHDVYFLNVGAGKGAGLKHLFLKRAAGGP